MQLALLNDTIQAYQRYLTLTINRFNGGVASKADVTLAQTQLFTTQASATDLDVTRNELEHAIAVLTGRAPAEVSIPPGQDPWSAARDSNRAAFPTAGTASGHSGAGTADCRRER